MREYPLIAPVFLAALSAMSAFSAPFRIARSDFKLLAMEIQCPSTCEIPENQAAEVLEMGFVGEGKFAEPTTPAKGPGGPRIVVGFPEERFDWGRFTRTLGATVLVTLNELTSSGKNHAFLSQWKPHRDSLEFLRLLPGNFPIPLGELTFQGRPQSGSAGTMVLLQGLGADAGVKVQAFFAIALQSRSLSRMGEAFNRSDIPVNEILARLNEGKPAEEVSDSTLRCELGRGAAVLRCTKSRARVLYTLQGPVETPLGSETFTVPLAPRRQGMH